MFNQGDIVRIRGTDRRLKVVDAYARAAQNLVGCVPEDGSPFDGNWYMASQLEPADESFAIGDWAELVSGGPPMEIFSVHPASRLVTAVWDGPGPGERNCCDFAWENLKRIPRPSWRQLPPLF